MTNGKVDIFQRIGRGNEDLFPHSPRHADDDDDKYKAYISQSGILHGKKQCGSQIG